MQKRGVLALALVFCLILSVSAVSAFSFSGIGDWFKNLFGMDKNVRLGPPTNGLVAYYPFDNDFNDASGNNFNLAKSGDVNFVAGKSGQAITLLGDGSHASIPLPDAMKTNELSYSVWVNSR